MIGRKRVLFLCTENSCRSQMAEGLLRSKAADRFDVSSAGGVATGLNANAVSVMAEIGIDISDQRSKSVDEYEGQAFDYVITVCGSSEDGSCPIFRGNACKQLHWPFADPADAVGDENEVLKVFRHVRDQIRKKVDTFVKEESVTAAS